MTIRLHFAPTPPPSDKIECLQHGELRHAKFAGSPNVSWLGPGFDMFCCLQATCDAISSRAADILNPDDIVTALSSGLFADHLGETMTVRFEGFTVNRMAREQGVDPDAPVSVPVSLGAQRSGTELDQAARPAVTAVLAAHERRGITATDRLLGQLEEVVRIGGEPAVRLTNVLRELVGRTE